MPNIKSAIKRVEVAERNRRRNRTWKSMVRAARNRVTEAAKSGKPADALKALNEAFSKIDKAVSKGVLHKNTAARRKARLTKTVVKAATEAPKSTTKSTSKASKTTKAKETKA